jgi:hypothetical protein
MKLLRTLRRHLKSLSFNFSGFGCALAFYTAPIHTGGKFQIWKGQHSSYRHGYVVRALWLGFVVRWGPTTRIERYLKSPLQRAIQEANDGDYPDPVLERYLTGSPGLGKYGD